MRIVLDTNFLISAMQWDYSVSHKLLEKLIRDNAEMFITKEILEEFSEVLRRDFLYSEEETNNLIEIIIQFLVLVNPSKKINIVKEDPDDNKVIECAIESEAEFIISYDKHLLKLKEYNGIKIITPDDFFDVV